MGKLNFVGFNVPDCSIYPRDSQQCEDCCVGAHSVGSGTFWDLIHTFTPAPAPAPYSVASGDIAFGISVLSSDSANGVWAVFDPEKKFNQNNIGLTWGEAPVFPIGYKATQFSIPLLRGILNNFPRAVNFNFYIGNTGSTADGYVVVLSITDAENQIIYHCDYSGIEP